MPGKMIRARFILGFHSFLFIFFFFFSLQILFLASSRINIELYEVFVQFRVLSGVQQLLRAANNFVIYPFRTFRHTRFSPFRNGDLCFRLPLLSLLALNGFIRVLRHFRPVFIAALPKNSLTCGKHKKYSKVHFHITTQGRALFL